MFCLQSAVVSNIIRKQCKICSRYYIVKQMIADFLDSLAAETEILLSHVSIRQIVDFRVRVCLQWIAVRAYQI